MSETERTYWRCERCERQGFVEYEQGADIYSVVGLLESAHNVDAPLRCMFDLSLVRVSREPFTAARTARSAT